MFELGVVEFIATLSCTLFTGAAIYVNLVGYPARMGCETTSSTATGWGPRFKRATLMQASLALISCAAGVGTWWLSKDIVWLIGAVLIGLVAPLTFVAIMPTNYKLLRPNRDLTSDETLELLYKWGKVHSVRSGLSLIASLIYLVLLIRG